MDNNTTNKTQRVRGSARIQPDGTFDFKPDGQGVKKIEEVSAQGDSPPVHIEKVHSRISAVHSEKS